MKQTTYEIEGREISTRFLGSNRHEVTQIVYGLKAEASISYRNVGGKISNQKLYVCTGINETTGLKKYDVFKNNNFTKLISTAIKAGY